MSHLTNHRVASPLPIYRTDLVLDCPLYMHYAWFVCTDPRENAWLACACLSHKQLHFIVGLFVCKLCIKHIANACYTCMICLD